MNPVVRIPTRRFQPNYFSSRKLCLNCAWRRRPKTNFLEPHHPDFPSVPEFFHMVSMGDRTRGKAGVYLFSAFIFHWYKLVTINHCDSTESLHSVQCSRYHDATMSIKILMSPNHSFCFLRDAWYTTKLTYILIPSPQFRTITKEHYVGHLLSSPCYQRDKERGCFKQKKVPQCANNTSARYE